MSAPSPPNEKGTWVQTSSRLVLQERRATPQAPDLSSVDGPWPPQKEQANGLGLSRLPLCRSWFNTSHSAPGRRCERTNSRACAALISISTISGLRWPARTNHGSVVGLTITSTPHGSSSLLTLVRKVECREPMSPVLATSCSTETKLSFPPAA
jgi:hypothetical protein